MDNRFFEKPILNSPYEYPARHWELNDQGQPTQQIIDRRRRAFAEFTDVYQIASEFEAKVEAEFNKMIDQAVEFVLGKIDRSVGTRAISTQAPVAFEIPRPVITEAIVNAITHRNYRHNGFVQVIVFADRVEVWNPGELPPGLTPELLRKPHGPIPRNPLIAEPLFRVKYVEKAGTGTTDMIADCRKAGLPEPDFEQRGPHFVVTVWRDWLTDEVLAGFNLNARQMKAVKYIKFHGRITNAEYQRVVGCPQRTATRDLNELAQNDIVKLEGKGRGAQYRFLKKRAINAPNAPSGGK